jgi:hypothetical protein
MLAVLLVVLLLPSLTTMIILVAWSVLLIMRAYGRTTSMRGPRFVAYHVQHVAARPALQPAMLRRSAAQLGPACCDTGS